MANKSNLSMVRPGLGLSLILVGTAFGLVACSDSASDGADGVTNTVTSGGVTMTSGTMTSTTSGTTTMGSTVTTGSAVTSSTSSSTSAGGASTTGTSTATSASSSGGMGTTGTGTTTTTTSATSAGGMGTTGIGTTTANTGAGGTGGLSGDEDIDMTGDDFSCIGDWDKVLGFRITNLLGHLDEALAVANNQTGVYPVGTLIQHLPTEAMVKRRAGFSPETRDWEFFLLTLGSDGTTTIAERGTTAIQTSMGETCVSCHSMVPEEYDFICNTWGDQGGANCGFDFMDSFLDQQLATDTRCQ